MVFPTTVALAYFLGLSTPVDDANAPLPREGNAAMQAAYARYGRAIYSSSSIHHTYAHKLQYTWGQIHVRLSK